MNKHEARDAVTRIVNLSAFSKRSKLPLRTLFRIRAGTAEPTAGTLMMLGTALKRFKPEMREPEELHAG
jgi:predicted transcriptional regulator